MDAEWEELKRRAKAAKADDAAVPIHVWRHFLTHRQFRWDSLRNRFAQECDKGVWRLQEVYNHALPTNVNTVGKKGERCFGSTLSTLDPDKLERALNGFRKLGLQWWKRRVTRSFIRFRRLSVLDPSHQLWSQPLARWDERKECYVWCSKGRRHYSDWHCFFSGKRDEWWDPGVDAVERMGRSDWWSWTMGSSPFFWRWEDWFMPILARGMKVYFVEEFPLYTQGQSKQNDPAVRAKEGEKLATVVERGYVVYNPNLRSYTNFFSVPKGETDIRMVYDLSKSGLNKVLWCPRFPLPSVDTHLRGVMPGTWMADLDVGEMFLNFWLHSELRDLCGVDLKQHADSCGEAAQGQGRDFDPRLMSWSRCAMGLKISPYSTVRCMMMAEEVVLGRRDDQNNPFRWDRVTLNYPGRADYDPSMPWVYKVRQDGTLAAEFYSYVDDARNGGPTEVECWQGSRRIGSTFSYLGIQDAARKRREPSQTPGAWNGGIITSDKSEVCVLVSQERWDKGKSLVMEMTEMWEESGECCDRKRLESIRGFLLYVARTYPILAPFLKGLHLTIDGWRPGRDETGWKLPGRKKRRLESGLGLVGDRGGLDVMEWDEEDAMFRVSSLDAPANVSMSNRMGTDLEALNRFFDQEEPPRRRVRGNARLEVYYGFGDASGAGFGATLDQISGQPTDTFYRFGQWCSAESEESSNYRELRNLVDSVKHFVLERNMDGAEFFMFTDNEVAESVFYKGNSRSRKLFELMLELRMFEMEHGLNLHVIHVSGKRMQNEGTDGLSRADFSTGVMAGEDVTAYIPLHLSAEERSPGVTDWFRQLADFPTATVADMASTLNREATILDEEGWFTTGHGPGTYVWAPAPAGADVVAEQLGKARHKRPHAMHLVLVPRLMTGRWRRQLTRESDFYFRIPAGSPLWPRDMCEPLLVFVCLPFVPHRPWLFSERERVDELVDSLLQEGVWEKTHQQCGSLLRELLLDAWSLSTVSQELV